MPPKRNAQPPANAQNHFSQITKVLFVQNLNYQTDRHQLETVFSIYNLESCYILTDKTGISLGNALLTFRTQADASQAMDQLNETLIDNHKIQISFANPENITEYEYFDYQIKQNVMESQEKYRRYCCDRDFDRHYLSNDFNKLNNGVDQIQQQMTGFQTQIQQQMTGFQTQMQQQMQQLQTQMGNLINQLDQV